MGLGLSISRTVTENHGSHLSAENRAIGARFGFECPLRGAVSRSG